ncbi:hypothetical protein EV182_001209 [Spiromyces aspiralis]|uniref:Uncharacterized protein n=1 Tax=Spiromyces aspiralis TaxID=68401 RepID=A0ACC1HVS4_9FUNG|nr:hypothetical protein EV182_001209 [Spiromyces aspiralis]
MNPYISRVYHQYYDAFERLREFPPVKDLGAEAQFTNALLRQTQLLSDVIPTIAQGFHECKKYMDEKDTTEFLNDLITARIGMRVIGEQHVELSHQYREALRDPGAERGEGEVETARRQDTLSDWVGSINISLEPAKMIKQICMYAQNICELHYGTAPEFIIDGVVDTSMTYIPSHLEYIIMEIVKNAFRATIEYSTKTRRLIHPPVRITVSKGVKYVGIRVRDEGGGIPKADMPHVFDYSWTSMKEKAAGGTDAAGDSSSVFSIQANLDMQSGTGGPIAGLGFGLPMAKLYCQYFGGSLEIASMEGLGCDVFIKLPCLELNLNRTII